ncbi:Proteasome activator complex subunit 4 [Toxocara canis]|uniref:Proteasome activator complex subunit 4 n=1 Tax=Toxocara canis TaxID=6265 RepID=A0A0B2VAJ1_TOXCA|nr:Proteasome activator complex subunit 4 [Toxocara canis]
MRHSDKPSIMKLVDESCTAVLLQRWNNAQNIFSQNLVQLSKCFWDNKSRYALKPFWEPLADTDQTAAKAKALRQCNERRRKIEKIRDELIDVCNNVGKTLHWRNVDSSSFMLVTLFRMNYDPKAIQVFLQMFHEERPSWRDIGATTVFGWLKWNKPPSVRSFWKPPAKVEEKAAPYACGMRPDNVCLAYDLNSLPSTKKLWDETVFITKPHWGTFQWPRTLKTFAPYDKQIHLSRPFDKLTPTEKTVVNTLGEIGFLQRWHLTLLREKEDSEPFSIYTFNVVKRGQQRLGAESIITNSFPLVVVITDSFPLVRSLAYAAIFSTAYGDQKLIPEQYRLPSIAGVISVFQEELEEILRDIKMHKSYEHHKQIVTLFRSLFASPSSENLHAAEAAETTKKNIYVKSLLLFLKAYYLLGFTAFPPSIMSLYTLLAHLADEEKSRADGDGRQIELQADAAHVFHQVWATAYLCEGTIDEMISKTREVLLSSRQWRTWVSILKLLSVLIFSNIFICERKGRPTQIAELIHRAICHHQVEVRKEAANCLTVLVHCGHYRINKAFIAQWEVKTAHSDLAIRHGAVLGLSAVLRAYPFTIPPFIPDAILTFCKNGASRDAVIRFLASFLGFDNHSGTDSLDRSFVL